MQAIKPVIEATVSLPFAPGDIAWQKSLSREVVLVNAFSSAGHIFWSVTALEERLTVPASDLAKVPQLNQPLKAGDRVKINEVPWTVIRDAFPSLPGAKGALARKIAAEREANGKYVSLEQMRNRLGLAQVNWEEIALQLDFS